MSLLDALLPGNRKIFKDGVQISPARDALDFKGSSFTVGDNPSTGRTDITIALPQAPIPIDVRSFGAVGNGLADDTLAIQAAIDAAWKTGVDLVGGEVWLPPTTGGYRVTAKLIVRRHVSLRGSFRGMRLGARVYDGTDTFGSMIITAHSDVGFEVHAGACVDGIEVWDPAQVTSGAPIDTGDPVFKVPAGEHGATLRNIAAPNPARFATVEADALLENIITWPLISGIVITNGAREVRIRDVAFTPDAHP